jgi:hypothetical protein
VTPAHHIALKDWVDETVVIVASGPSTQHVDLTLLEGHRIVVVAHGYRAVPYASVLVVGGQAFYASNKLSDFRGDLVIAAQECASWSWLRQSDERLVYMRRAGALGLTDDPGALCGSESSVMLAINYVVHRGVKQIVLLGCDGKPGQDGQRRIGNTGRDTANALARYQAQERAMSSQIAPLAALGISIVNASPDTALTVYPKQSLKEALA